MLRFFLFNKFLIFRDNFIVPLSDYNFFFFLIFLYNLKFQNFFIDSNPSVLLFFDYFSKY